ncbi:MAG: hypothetical protein EOO41_00950 [Methanobacteriota archaeon]|nr:MAG: hypothetical protein EOO41_00950 [Euryarchaeota archaeon]
MTLVLMLAFIFLATNAPLADHRAFSVLMIAVRMLACMYVCANARTRARTHASVEDTARA